ncbi:hypothetical protein JOB18_048946 [Solea senegalensis]|uniref:Uncharacterized protein n=1 Tax=Solea senegalensis TaxID=28829 RepID=A0AAV6S8Z4_SOLSE|nr:hypothetical protein JOB18_048946 [Solea senegalensis]
MFAALTAEVSSRSGGRAVKVTSAANRAATEGWRQLARVGQCHHLVELYGRYTGSLHHGW